MFILFLEDREEWEDILNKSQSISDTEWEDILSESQKQPQEEP